MQLFTQYPDTDVFPADPPLWVGLALVVAAALVVLAAVALAA
jgi:hypothetical protein